MNIEQHLQAIAKYLDTQRPAHAGTYVLRIIDKSIKLEHGCQTCDSEGVLAVLTSRDINEGCTPGRWNNIRDRFAIFQKRGLI